MVGLLLVCWQTLSCGPTPEHVGISSWQMFEAAKRWLEEKHNFTVVVGWISPSHDHYVAGKVLIAHHLRTLTRTHHRTRSS